MKLKEILKKLSSGVTLTKSPYENRTLCGVPLRVLPNTTRVKEDQDDCWWFYLTKNHNVIYDVGSNAGYSAIIALIQNPLKKIILVDPNPKALQKAAQNLIENGLGNNAQYVSAFVGDKLDSKVKFYTVGAGAAGSMHASHAKSAAAANSFMEVSTITLDHMLSFYNVKPDLVKIDVEGAETLVMQAAKKLATETKCTFFIEMHNVEGLGMEAAAQSMLDWCEEMDYKAWYPTTGNALAGAEEIKDRGKCHLLLLPKDKDYPEYLKGIAIYAPLPKTI
ncbi:MAG: FkbM family methyltransferase [Algicola sp.]|nr:FkbM family methyltransferase [Algicola sp.]